MEVGNCLQEHFSFSESKMPTECTLAANPVMAHSAHMPPESVNKLQESHSAMKLGAQGERTCR